MQPALLCLRKPEESQLGSAREHVSVCHPREAVSSPGLVPQEEGGEDLGTRWLGREEGAWLQNTGNLCSGLPAPCTPHWVGLGPSTSVRLGQQWVLSWPPTCLGS